MLLRAKAVHRADPVAGVLHGHILLDDAEVKAVLGGIGRGHQAAVAGADDQDVGVPGLGDGGLVDVGLGAQSFSSPVGSWTEVTTASPRAWA